VWLRIAGREGYKTVNLGVSGDTTADMRRRIGQMLSEGQPEIAVVFGGGNDALRRVDPAETKQNVSFIVEWLRARGIGRIVLIGPELPDWEQPPDWLAETAEVRRVLTDVAERYGVIFVDLALFLRDVMDRGQEPDFSRVRARQPRSWHVEPGDPHFNPYGQRLIAEAFLRATVGWR
jgi:lysophospholipase L1-like esterase